MTPCGFPALANLERDPASGTPFLALEVEVNAHASRLAAASVLTKRVSFVNTALTCAASASARNLLPLDS